MLSTTTIGVLPGLRISPANASRMAVATMVTMFALGCGSEPKAQSKKLVPSRADSADTNPGTATTPNSNSTEDAPQASITDVPCTEPASICTTYTLPADMKGTPSRIFVGFYKKLPPAGPPDVFGSEVKSAVDVKPGQTFTLKQTGITGLEGSYFIYTVLYMEGGGQFLPKPGIDYVATTDEAVTFTGGAASVSDLAFKVAE